MAAETSYRVRASGAEVDCREDQPLLDSLLRGGVWMPNSCNQGTCGTCKVQVMHGRVDHEDSPLATLPAAERAAGMALACQARPCSDVEVRSCAAETEDTSTHQLRDLIGTVAVLEDIAEDTRRLVLSLDRPLEHSAGQYAEIRIPGTGVNRQYSMANAPAHSASLEFHIRRTEGGLATDRWIFSDLAPGHQVELTGPYGDFCYTDVDADSPMILLAGGTGLAPLRSIMEHALEVDPAREIHLYHGVRWARDLYDVEHLRALTAIHPNVQYVPSVSRGDWAGRSGYVSDAVLEDFSSCKGYSGYVCGPPAMVESAIKALKRRRMAPRMIRRETFEPAPKMQPLPVG
jgi:NAD(P)H-flavin reductase/ferredoxin